jgi:hypothetical protein
MPIEATNIYLKGATHMGEVVVDGTAQEVWLKEATQSWSDGRRRWKKFDLRGDPSTDPRWLPKSWSGQRSATLITATIRRLTVSDLRRPLAQRLADTDLAVAYRQTACDSATVALDAAYESQGKAATALAKFDKKHGLDGADQ